MWWSCPPPFPASPSPQLLRLPGAKELTACTAAMPSCALPASQWLWPARPSWRWEGKGREGKAVCAPALLLRVGHIPAGSLPPSYPACSEQLQFPVHTPACMDFCQESLTKTLLNTVCFLPERRWGGVFDVLYAGFLPRLLGYLPSRSGYSAEQTEEGCRFPCLNPCSPPGGCHPGPSLPKVALQSRLYLAQWSPGASSVISDSWWPNSAAGEGH